MQNALLKFGERGYNRLKKFFIDETPKGTSCGKQRRLRHMLGESTGAFRRRIVTRSEKKLANKICATSLYWADKLLGANVVKVGL
jgi:hypothetical protein